MTNHSKYRFGLAGAAATFIVALLVGCGDRSPSGPVAPAPGDAPSSIIGQPTPLPVIDPQEAYDAALASAESLAVLGIVPQETVDYLVQNEAALSASLDALEDAIGGVQFTVGAPRGGFAPLGGSGGVVSGTQWESRSLVGLKVGEFQVDVAWSSTGGNSRITGFTHNGGIILGSVWAKQVGSTWIETCECSGNHAPGEPVARGIRLDTAPERGPWTVDIRRTPSAEFGAEPIDEHGEVCTRECGNFQICYKQKFRFRTLGSGCTDTETICTPCE
jgi:hypothetical protein